MAAKNMLYVSGLADDVKEADLFALFGPFGDIIAVQIPINSNKESRGFGFVTFESADDAAQALDNMDDAEYFGRVLKVNISKPMKLGENNRAIWTVDRDGYDAIKDGESAPSEEVDSKA